MRDDGALHRLPGIDVEITRRSVQAPRSGDDEIAHVGSPSLRE
jgi:hypothetical protein